MLTRDTVQRPLASCLWPLCAPVTLAASLLFVLPAPAASAQSPVGDETSTARSELGQLHQERPHRSTEPREKGAHSGDLDLVDGDTGVAPEDRTYTFDIKDGTYRQLVDDFAWQTGLGVVGAPPRRGKVDLVTSEGLTFDETLGRVRLLLFNYKPNQPYWLLWHETHFEVIRVRNLLGVLPDDRIFQSVVDFRAANLPADDIALVVFTPPSGVLSDLNVVREFMPDYVRLTPLKDRNAVTVFALVKDIEKYLSLAELFADGGEDPRTLEVIEVKHILPSDAISKLEALMDLNIGQRRGTSGRSARRGGRSTRATRKRARARRADPFDAIVDPETVVLPDDERGVIVVQAMQDKIDQIRGLLPYIDVGTTANIAPVIIDLEHANAWEVAEAIRQILAVSEAASVGSGARKARSTRRLRGSRRSRSGAVPALATVGEVPIVPHPTFNAIVVLAEGEGVSQVRKLVELLDVEACLGPLRIDLKYADANDISETLTSIMSGAGRRPVTSNRIAIIADPSGAAIWVTGREQDLATLRELVSVMDSANEVASLHVIQLERQVPSFVAKMLQQYDAVRGRASALSGSSRMGRRTRAKARRNLRSQMQDATTFIPDDDHDRLFTLCTDEHWEEYVPVIEQLESALDDEELFVRLELAHIGPEEAIDRLSALFEGSARRDSQIHFAVGDGELLVIGADPAEIEDMRAFLNEMDKPAEIERATFEIEYADPDELMATIQALHGEAGSSSVSKRRGPATRRGRSRTAVNEEELRIVRIDTRLVVEAPPVKMEKVANLIEELDVAERETEIRVYEAFSPRADIESIAEVIATATDGYIPPRGHSRKRSVHHQAGPVFVPQQYSGRLIVQAEPEAFARIEEMLEALDLPDTRGIVIRDVELTTADPQMVVESVSEFLRLPGGTAGDDQGQGDLHTAYATGVPISIHAVPDRSAVVLCGVLEEVERATEWVEQLDPDIRVEDTHAGDIQLALIDLEFADPVEVVNAIGPWLDIKVRELIAAGRLPDTPVRSPSPRKRRRNRRSGTGKSESEYYHLAADTLYQRIVIGAPRLVVDEATQLIEEFDLPDDAERIIVRTVELTHADPAAIISSVGEILGAPTRRGARRARGQRSSLPGTVTTDSLSLRAAPGGEGLVLYGSSDEVDEAAGWIEELDALSSNGRAVNVYRTEYADAENLADFIMSVVDSSGPGRGRPRTHRASQLLPEEDKLSTSRTWRGRDVYIQAGLIDRVLIVAASRSKLSEIDRIVAQFDTEEVSAVLNDTTVPKLLYELEHVEAFDAAFELEMILNTLWKPSDQVPTVDVAPFGNMLIIRYLDEDRFPEIEELITGYVDKPDPDRDRIIRRSFVVPRVMTAQEAVKWLQETHQELDIEVKDISEAEDYGIERIRPRKAPSEFPQP